MFTASIMICLSNLPESKDNCLVLQNDSFYKTEEECTQSVADILNNELFQYAYDGYELKDYECRNWLKTDV